MAQEKDEKTGGHDLPETDGRVSDEDMQAITDDSSDKPIGQDHSTEHHERQMPTSGVGAIQDNSLIKENVAHIEDES